MTTGRINQVTIFSEVRVAPGGSPVLYPSNGSELVVGRGSKARSSARRRIAPSGSHWYHPFATTEFSKVESAKEFIDESTKLWHVHLRWRLPVAGHAAKDGYRYTSVPPSASR